MAPVRHSRIRSAAGPALAFVLFLIAGLAASRLLYEVAFPRLLFLARVIPVTLIALLAGVLGWLALPWANGRLGRANGRLRQRTLSPWSFLPLAINLLTIFDPSVDLVASRLIFAVSVWLTALLCVQNLWHGGEPAWLAVLLILLALLPIYLGTMSHAVGEADTFEFQVVIPQLGIAHPTGYPLYMLLGRLFTFIPAGSVAWRVNLASTVFAIAAVLLLYDMTRRLLQHSLPAVLTAVLLGVSPVFWSQAIVAEVYALQALIVAATLWLMLAMPWPSAQDAGCSEIWIQRPIALNWQRATVALSFLIGLGLANHLTSLFLIPPAVLAVALGWGACLRKQSWKENGRLLLKVASALSLPLLLYAYLPLRWSALHQEAMGMERFVGWVIGGRFQGALQPMAWLTDGTRYEVVGRLFLQNWGWFNLTLAVLGLLHLLRINWRSALVLFVTWLGFSFYALNYYVPDLAVFLIPAHLVLALFWGAGLAAVWRGIGRTTGGTQWQGQQWPFASALVVLALLPAIGRLGSSWEQMRAAENEQMLRWGEAVLGMPLDDQAAILADSEKIAPLYYLQQAEGVRPDLDIMVLPDEAAYRAELNARIDAGQTVYLARFLPGLAGTYHLRSVGPLIEVSREPLMSVPRKVEERDMRIGPLTLVGVDLEESSPIDPSAVGLTLYWQRTGAGDEPAFVYLRWAGENSASLAGPSSGQHPAGNYYPAGAWQPGEVVPDFRLVPRPVTGGAEILELQVAVGPSFQDAQSLPWHTVASVSGAPLLGYETKQVLRAQNGRALLSGVDFAQELRPQTPLAVVLTGYGSEVPELELALRPAEEEPAASLTLLAPSVARNIEQRFVYATELATDLPNGTYWLVSQDPRAPSICGWLSLVREACILGTVRISGTPLPRGATNYDDKIALLDVDLPQLQLEPGGQLPVSLRWQSLGAMDEDYTVFLQVLNAADQIVGQIDAWPVQGTYPTSQWGPGEVVADPHLIQLDADLPPGQYRLQIGWYLLSTLERLPVLNDDGQPIDDKVEIQGLTAGK